MTEAHSTLWQQIPRAGQSLPVIVDDVATLGTDSKQAAAILGFHSTQLIANKHRAESCKQVKQSAVDILMNNPTDFNQTAHKIMHYIGSIFKIKMIFN